MENFGASISLVDFLVIISGSDVAEKGKRINEEFKESAEDALNALLSKTSFSSIARAKLVIHKSFSGSWIIDASLYLWTEIPVAFAVLEAVSKIPEILEGLTKIENQVKTLFSRRLNKISPDASVSVIATLSNTKEIQSTYSCAINWQAEMQNYIGRNVILSLRHGSRHISGILTSINRGVVRVEDDREESIVLLGDIFGVSIIKN